MNSSLDSFNLTRYKLVFKLLSRLNHQIGPLKRLQLVLIITALDAYILIVKLILGECIVLFSPILNPGF